MFDVEI